MPDIATLVPDIYAMLQKREGTDLVLDEWAKHGANMTNHIHTAISENTRPARSPDVIYASEIGKKCVRQIWYRMYTPSVGLDTKPWTKFKFLYGSLIEESVLALAKAAGHEVRAEQAEVFFALPNGWMVKGRLDAIIDGVVVDVKSMAPYSFGAVQKAGFNETTDKFGYRAQVDFYARCMTSGKQGQILGVDKVNGHLGLFPVRNWATDRDMRIGLTNLTDKLDVGVLPDRAFEDEEKGLKGNRGLCTECSYCEFKKQCWPGLRGFAYANGPMWLTKVVDEPKVKEIFDDDEA